MIRDKHQRNENNRVRKKNEFNGNYLKEIVEVGQ